jgi:uncharacterized protein with ParB-like and HNH nuclease domain
LEAGKRTIRDIFNRGRNLEIPFFQRSYVWSQDQWERFLDDMRFVSQNRENYFLGSIILKQQQTSSDTDSKITVIDGQQRLTTLQIFLKVLCLKHGSDTDFTETFKKQRDKTIILLHNHNDVKYFNMIMNLDELIEISENNSIIDAYKYFSENITDDDLIHGLDFFNILDNILFVGIDLGYEEDEQQIFDTINSLGVRLTTAELLKNYFFNRDEISTYNEYWKSIFEKDEETKTYWDIEVTTGRIRRTFIDLFFHSFLQIMIQDPNLKVKAEDKKKYSKLETLFASYKNFREKYILSKHDFLSQIKEYALIFKENFNYDIVNDELTDEFGIERINAIIFGLDTSTLIPYILYILKNVSDTIQRNELFELLETYIMRRLIVHATAKNYNQLFSERLIANKSLNERQFLEYIENSSDTVNFLPNNDSVKNGFENSKLTNKQSAGILYFLESKIRNRERHSTKLLGINKYSLEHLMPKKWENNWDKIDDKDARGIRNSKLLTLGNLTIITQKLNAAIRDSSWNIKKQGKSNKGGLRTYSAGIETLERFLEYEKWDESTIEERANYLYKKAIAIWDIENL